jgi:hypothetical protein
MSERVRERATSVQADHAFLAAVGLSTRAADRKGGHP